MWAAGEPPGGAFPLRVAVAASPAARRLRPPHLLRPFARQLHLRGQVKDPVSGTQCAVKSLKLSFSDVNSTPPQPALARKLLNESVSNNYSDKTVFKNVGKFSLDIPESTPWFEAWRDTFLQVQFPSDHEFTRHYVSCLLFVTASEPHPIETMADLAQKLTQMQNPTQPKVPKWFNNNVLRCYVLLHDNVDGNMDTTKKYFEQLKNTYGGGNCFLLCLNTKIPPDSEGDSSNTWPSYLGRKTDINDYGSDKDSLARTPTDPGSLPSVAVSIISDSDKNERSLTPPSDKSTIVCESATEASESGAITVQVHPLSPSEDIESCVVFDSGNSLQDDVTINSLDSDININSTTWDSGSGPSYESYLSPGDTDNIKAFIQDFSCRALLPYFERQIYQLQDAVANRKGVSRSILNATKRWFSTSKPGTNMPPNTVIYASDCPELQLRRLGDIWFMLGQWNLAFQSYHTAKKEYYADNALLCYAGALEMAALSDYMSNEIPKKMNEYMDESILKYYKECGMPQYAVRATLLSVHCLMKKGYYEEAARQLLRMTSEECDLRSALLLEQAALCYLKNPNRRCLPRKYAFNMILAGHRFSKAGQRNHSLRCYKHAYQIYRGGGWRLATDHIEYSIGKMAGQTKNWGEAVGALSSLLSPCPLQAPLQQTTYLKEYLNVLQQWIASEPEQSSLPILPIPLLESNMTTILCGGMSTVNKSVIKINPSLSTNKIWINLEEMLLNKASDKPVMIFKPTLSLFSKCTNNSFNPVVPQNESVEVTVLLKNSLLINIVLADVELLWNFKSNLSSDLSDSGELFSNEICVIQNTQYDKSIVSSEKLPRLILKSNDITPLTFKLTPLRPGELNIVGVTYRLCSPTNTDENALKSVSILGKQIFDLKGPKLKNSNEYGVDKRLNILVVPPSPCLQVTFSEMNSELLCGELQRITVEFRNVGRVPLKSLFMGSSHPQYISLSVDSDKETDPFAVLIESMYRKPSAINEKEKEKSVKDREREKEKNMRNRHCIKILDSLGAGQVYNTTLFIRTPEEAGEHELHALFYYENSIENSLLNHRLYRYSWNITAKESSYISATCKHTLHRDNSEYKEAMNMEIGIKNTNELSHGILTSLEVQQISLLSQCWKLTSLVETHNIKTLNSEEYLNVIVSVRRDSVKNTETDVLHSDINLKSLDNFMSVKDRPYSSFVTNYASTFTNGELSTVANEEFDNNNYDGNVINSTLVVRWKADITEKKGTQRVAFGQHHLLLDRLNVYISSRTNNVNRSKDDLSKKSFVNDNTGNTTGIHSNVNLPADERLVTYCLEHEFECKHDFKTSFLCIVPIKIHLVNCSEKTVIAILNTSSPKGFADKYPGIAWVGVGGNETGGVQTLLDPFKSHSVSLQIACTAPGTYALGNIIRVLCRIKEKDSISIAILQGHVTSSTLIVEQA